MILKAAALPSVILIRPGATEFDEQGRIKGSMGMPLSQIGREQVSSLTDELRSLPIKTIYTAPCESAKQTAQQLAAAGEPDGREMKIKVIESFRNLDHGLWHGKLVEDLKRNHPKLYRRGQESPDEICPPEGESIVDARERVAKAIKKLLRKSGEGVVAIVIPEPMGWIVRAVLRGEELSGLWNAQTDNASWELIPSDLLTI